MKRILFTGCAGQIGSELLLAFRKKYGADAVVASDIAEHVSMDVLESGPFEKLDVLNTEAMERVVEKYDVGSIVHLAAILSAVGEVKPQLAWNVNINGAYNVLEIARTKKLERVLIPSSMAAFGPDTPKDNAPQKTILLPTTMYGVTKVTIELLGNYYNLHYGMDVRGLRYPGIISHKTAPGGGTTDYAVAIYFDAVKKGSYECFLKEDSLLPMMYMPDCLKATMDLFAADKSKLSYSTGYNVSAFSVTPAQIADSIRKIIPNFTITYKPDERQAIADSWVNSMDDTQAAHDWGWKASFDLDTMTRDMITAIRAQK